MSVKVVYKEKTIAEVDTSKTVSLQTKGKYCEDDISILISETFTASQLRHVFEYGQNILKDANDIYSFTIPDGVTMLGSGMFDSSNIRYVTIPSTCIRIGDRAFKNCKSLQNFTLPTNLKSIGAYAFYCCKSLTSLVLPDSVTSIDEYAFAGENYEDPFFWSISSVNIPSGVTKIAPHTFEKNGALKSVTLSEGLKTIDNHAFYHCINLTQISFPNSVTEIGSNSFTLCEKLQLPTLPSNLLAIRENAFSGCIIPSDVTFPSKLETIESHVFVLADGLNTITLPTTIKSIAADAFYLCDNLTTINVPWAKGAIPNAPWGATNATINYNYTGV